MHKIIIMIIMIIIMIIEDEAPGKQWIFLMIFFNFPEASSSFLLCMVAQPEY